MLSFLPNPLVTLQATQGSAGNGHVREAARLSIIMETLRDSCLTRRSPFQQPIHDVHSSIKGLFNSINRIINSI